LIEDYYAFLSGLARRLHGVLRSRRKAEELKALQDIGWRVYSRPTLSDTLEDVLDAVIDTLGFEFALISLVDEDEQRISAVSGRNLPSGQIQDCVHQLDDKDITADVVRTGEQEVLSGWDPRFDERIWNSYGHENMVRVFTPIGGSDGNHGERASGVIEAGYYTRTRETIEDAQLAMLKVFAQQVFNAIENARLYERTRRRAEILTSLQHISNKVSYSRNVDTVLNDVVESIKSPLDADIVMLYPRSRQAGGLLSPYVAGELFGLELSSDN
jgi:GAF domain-containing protein